MRFQLILVLCVAVLMTLLQASSSLTGAAWARNEQQTKPQFILPYMLPDHTALELMQVGKYNAQLKQLKARREAGEEIEFGQLAVTSEPEGAGVLVSSYVPLGKTPYANDKLLPGLHRVTVRKDGFFEQVRMVNVKANERAALDFKLEPIPYARLTVTTRPPTTKVRIMDVEEAYAPGMKLAPGRYIVSLRHPMYGEQRLCAVLDPNQELTMHGDLAVLWGRLKIESDPPDAVIYVDGREEGRTPHLTSKTLLPPGPHLVQVWKSLYKPVSKVVQVQSHKTTEVKVDLPPAEHFANSVGMEFVKIPAGSFMMGFNGSPEFLGERIAKRQGFLLNLGIGLYSGFFQDYPQHLVNITRPFFMQTTEVTNDQWDRVMRTKSLYQNDEAQWPVNHININKAKEFIAKLNQIDKGPYHYRLPTEAEWEYAARAGTKGLFYSGDYITTDQANFQGKPDLLTGYKFGETRGHRIKVKSFAPNPWGLFDLHGNVYELCADWFDGFYYTRSPINDPKRAASKGGYYVMRGGSYSRRWLYCMSAAREHIFHSDSNYVCGIRLVAEKMID